jgi:hypothetical protein
MHSDFIKTIAQIKINKTDNKAHFLLVTNSYIFRQQGAALKEFIKDKNL